MVSVDGAAEDRDGLMASVWGCVFVFLIVCALTFPIVLGLAMTKGLSHDEHQHVAAGVLIARDGLLPYRDFPHFHTPYLAYAYSWIYRFTDHLLVGGRMLSVFSSTAIVGIIGAIAYRLFRARGRGIAIMVCAGSVLLASTTKLFTETAGYAWNHETPVLLSLVAFLAHIAGARSGNAGWFVMSGAVLGMAVGTRVTCAPLIAPFGLALILYPSRAWRWNRIFAFGSGLMLGLAGLIYFFAIAPEATFFGNFEFAKANIIYRFSTGEPRTMTILTKLRFFVKLIVRPDVALFVAGLLPLLAAYLANRGGVWRWRMEARFILLLLPFILVGCFAPSPSFDQYFFPLVPFLLILGLNAWSSIPQGSEWFRRVLIINSVALLLSIGLGIRGYADFEDFPKPQTWHGVKLHQEGKSLRSNLSQGRVLTLAPIYPLEAGFSIYPSFSTGPMAWRISPYIDPAKAARLKIATPATLQDLLAVEKPVGILVGFEKGEDLLIAHAKQNGYKRVVFDDDYLWIQPKAN